jgi:hypothetical protein
MTQTLYAHMNKRKKVKKIKIKNKIDKDPCHQRQYVHGTNNGNHFQHF